MSKSDYSYFLISAVKKVEGKKVDAVNVANVYDKEVEEVKEIKKTKVDEKFEFIIHQIYSDYYEARHMAECVVMFSKASGEWDNIATIFIYGYKIGDQFPMDQFQCLAKLRLSWSMVPFYNAETLAAITTDAITGEAITTGAITGEAITIGVTSSVITTELKSGSPSDSEMDVDMEIDYTDLKECKEKKDEANPLRNFAARALTDVGALPLSKSVGALERQSMERKTKVDNSASGNLATPTGKGWVLDRFGWIKGRNHLKEFDRKYDKVRKDKEINVCGIYNS